MKKPEFEIVKLQNNTIFTASTCTCNEFCTQEECNLQCASEDCPLE